MAVDVDGLEEIQEALWPKTHGVKEMVGILRAEAAEKHGAFIGFQVAIGILEEKHLGRVRHICAAIAWNDRRGDVEVLGENRGFVGLAVAIGIFENHDLILRLFTWLDMRISGAADDPKAALSIPVHLHWLLQERVASVKADFHAFGHDEACLFSVRVRIRHFRKRLGL